MSVYFQNIATQSVAELFTADATVENLQEIELYLADHHPAACRDVGRLADIIARAKQEAEVLHADLYDVLKHVERAFAGDCGEEDCAEEIEKWSAERFVDAFGLNPGDSFELKGETLRVASAPVTANGYGSMWCDLPDGKRTFVSSNAPLPVRRSVEPQGCCG